MTLVLKAIVDQKRREVSAAREATPLRAVRDAARSAPSPRDFAGALRRSHPAVIAEIKGASPSAGVIRARFDPADVARAYARGGADALSVVTDVRFFHGHSDHLRAAREAVTLPVMRKDFLLEPYQVYESRAVGADAVLLITRLLDGPSLRGMVELAWELAMEALVEVHSEAEVDMAMAAGAHLIGINNRDLGDFSLDLETTARLSTRIPADVLVVSESGIATAEDAARLAPHAHALLVGTALMAGEDPGALITALKSVGAHPR